DDELDTAAGVVAIVFLAGEVLHPGEHSLGVVRRGGRAVADEEVRISHVIVIDDVHIGPLTLTLSHSERERESGRPFGTSDTASTTIVVVFGQKTIHAVVGVGDGLRLGVERGTEIRGVIV